MVNHFLLELVNKSLIMFGMTSFSLPAGRRAAQLVPALRGQSVALARPEPTDDLKLFWMTFSGGLVFFLTFLS
ncbi:MAG TPA: hypothetical protein VF582_01750 [Allosphingosinicella sp.]|jgi:hypothetical protein